MKSLIFSPHTDDAIFSLGDTMQQFGDITIASVFAGIPDDQAGRQKHTTLHAEHRRAASQYGSKIINGPFLDDVYERPNEVPVAQWVVKQLQGDYDNVFVPLGIHHPDHIWLRDICLRHFQFEYFYRELPYGILYPRESRESAQFFTKGFAERTKKTTELKKEAVRAYQSQIQSSTILANIFVPEVIYYA